jgi:hypothetical protein
VECGARRCTRRCRPTSVRAPSRLVSRTRGERTPRLLRCWRRLLGEPCGDRLDWRAATRPSSRRNGYASSRALATREPGSSTFLRDTHQRCLLRLPRRRAKATTAMERRDRRGVGLSFDRRTEKAMAEVPPRANSCRRACPPRGDTLPSLSNSCPNCSLARGQRRVILTGQVLRRLGLATCYQQ